MRSFEVIRVGAVVAVVLLAATWFGPGNVQAHDWPETEWQARPGCGRVIPFGDTLGEMATRNKITLEEIETNNPWLDDVDKVGAGAVIDICPSERQVGAASSVSLDERIERNSGFAPAILPEAQRATPIVQAPTFDASRDELKAYVAQQAAGFGWTGDQITALEELVARESSWRPWADNPSSTAFGLFQFLRQTAIDYGMDHPDRNGVTPTVEAQVAAGLQYIDDRYGTPSDALWFHTRNNWY